MLENIAVVSFIGANIHKEYLENRSKMVTRGQKQAV
jgi:hypothetical protein